MNFAFWFSLAVFLIVAAVSLGVALGYRKMPHLDSTAPATSDSHPKVSVIVSALNEADTIAPALQSLLSLNYLNLEIIAINDRSTDATPAILDRMAQSHPALRVLHIEALPAGWLGKNHALHQGAQLAGGDYLIFTDADVIFNPDTIVRTVAYCEQHQLDHLTLLFDVIAKTQLLRMLILSFSISFMARFQPWKVNHSTKHFLGVGGFNMVKKTAYQAVGGHAAMPMAVIDDMMLGKLMKTRGYRQHALLGRELVAVEWYRSTPEMIRGIQKNAFAAFDYQISKLVLVTLAILALRVWPWVGLFITDGAARAVNAATILVGLALYADLLRGYGWSYRCLIFAPVISVLELAMFWRGSVLTLWRGGIDWRGTRYALQELKRDTLGKL